MVELIVALPLMGIVAAIALPTWNKLLPIYDLDSSAPQVQSELLSIKMRTTT
jgi:Tfp pilus assembly protein FimT